MRRRSVVLVCAQWLAAFAAARASGDAQPAATNTDLLHDAMNSFAKSYNDFAVKLNGGVFDRKLAGRLSKEWRSVEKSGEWPA
jgi:hypothetical protein